MAEIAAFVPIDMRVLDTLRDIEVARPGRVLVTDGPVKLDYRGSFSFDGAWGGTVERASLIEGGTVVWEATGLALPARFVRPGADGQTALEVALSGADVIHGSAGRDVLFGFAGNDGISGAAGADEVNGGTGADSLDGGRGGDTLRGGAGGDTFIFGGNGGDDRVEDFRDGLDVILLAELGLRFRDLDIERHGGDALVGYGEGSILLDGVAPRDLDRGDFLFT
jgi:Ca2+-binding RTX toxin-like protein